LRLERREIEKIAEEDRVLKQLAARLHIPGGVTALLVAAYLASGIYLRGSILLIGPWADGDRKTIHSEYVRQRLVPGVTPLKADSVIAGDPYFVDLAYPRNDRGRWLAISFGSTW